MFALFLQGSVLTSLSFRPFWPIGTARPAQAVSAEPEELLAPRLRGIEHFRRSTNGGAVGGKITGNHGTRPHRSVFADMRHHDRTGSDPATCTDAHAMELASFGTADRPALRPAMLAATTEYLDSGCDLASVSNFCATQDVEATDIDALPYSGLRMSKERAELHAAAVSESLQSESIVGGTEIVSWESWRKRNSLREELENDAAPPKPRKQSGGPHKCH